MENSAEAEEALERGELDFAITLAAELAGDRKHVPLETALRFLPLVATERPSEYDRWALRWLGRWSAAARAADVVIV